MSDESNAEYIVRLSEAILANWPFYDDGGTYCNFCSERTEGWPTQAESARHAQNCIVREILTRAAIPVTPGESVG